MFHVSSVSTVYLEDSFIKSGVFSVSELVRVSRSKYRPCGNPQYSRSLSDACVTILQYFWFCNNPPYCWFCNNQAGSTSVAVNPVERVHPSRTQEKCLPRVCVCIDMPALANTRTDTRSLCSLLDEHSASLRHCVAGTPSLQDRVAWDIPK